MKKGLSFWNWPCSFLLLMVCQEVFFIFVWIVLNLTSKCLFLSMGITLLPAHEPCREINISIYKYTYIVSILYLRNLHIFLIIKKLLSCQILENIMIKKSLKKCKVLMGFSNMHHLAPRRLKSNCCFMELKQTLSII